MAEMQKQMAQMSPAERKQMEDMMGKQGVRMAARSRRRHGGADVHDQGDGRAQRHADAGRLPDDQNPRSGNTMKMAFTCTNPPSSGEGQVTFSGPRPTPAR